MLKIFRGEIYNGVAKKYSYIWGLKKYENTGKTGEIRIRNCAISENWYLIFQKAYFAVLGYEVIFEGFTPQWAIRNLRVLILKFATEL